MKRTKSGKNKKRTVSDRLIPVVDEVVEMVFARLKDAAARAKKSTRKTSSARSKGAGAPSSIGENRDGLAGAVADLLLADLTHQPRKSSPGKKGAKRRPRATPRRRRS